MIDGEKIYLKAKLKLLGIIAAAQPPPPEPIQAQHNPNFQAATPPAARKVANVNGLHSQTCLYRWCGTMIP